MLFQDYCMYDRRATKLLVCTGLIVTRIYGVVLIPRSAKIVCSNCGFINELDLDDLFVLKAPKIIKILCKNCGVINGLEFDRVKDLDNKNNKEKSFLKCIPYSGSHKNWPVGYCVTAGHKLYTPQCGGSPLTRDDYIKEYGIDPEVALQKLDK